MKQTVFALVVAAFALGAASSVSQAAPIAPPASAITATNGNLTQVQYWRWHHRHWHHRRCWRDRWGRPHCRFW